MSRSIILSVTFFVMFSFPLLGKGGETSRGEVRVEDARYALKEIDGLVEHVLEKTHVPGVAIGVVVDNEIVLAKKTIGYNFNLLNDFTKTV